MIVLDEGRIRIDLAAEPLADDQLGMRDVEVVAELGAGRTLDAMVRPQDLRAVGDVDQLERLAAGVVRSERLVVRRVPILGQDNVAKLSSQTVDHRDDLVAVRHRQRTLRTKVVLDVDDEKNVAFADGKVCAHDPYSCWRSNLRSVSSASRRSAPATSTG